MSWLSDLSIAHRSLHMHIAPSWLSDRYWALIHTAEVVSWFLGSDSCIMGLSQVFGVWIHSNAGSKLDLGITHGEGTSTQHVWLCLITDTWRWARGW